MSTLQRVAKKTFSKSSLIIPSIIIFVLTYSYFKSYDYVELYEISKKYMMDILVLFLSLIVTFILTTYYIMKKTLKFNAGFAGIFMKRKALEDRYQFGYALNILRTLDQSSFGIQSQTKLEIYKSIIGFEIGVIYSYVRLVYASLFPSVKNFQRGNISNFENVLYDSAIEIFLVHSEHIDKLKYTTPEGKLKKIRKFIIDEYREEKKEMQSSFMTKLFLQIDESSSPYEALLRYITLWESYIEDYMFFTKKWLEFQNGRYEGALTFASFVSQSFKELPNCNIGIEGEYGIGVVSWRRTNDLLEHYRVGKTIIDVMIEHTAIDKWIFDCRKMGSISTTIMMYWIRDWSGQLLSHKVPIKSIAIVYPRETYSRDLILKKFANIFKGKVKLGKFATTEQALIWSVTQ